MRAYQFPYPETERETVVSRFGGADFRTHPTKVSLSRSPDLQNLICDQNDFLVKRTGWKTQQNYNAPLFGLFPLPDGFRPGRACGYQAVRPSRHGYAGRAVHGHERGVLAIVRDERRIILT